MALDKLFTRDGRGHRKTRDGMNEQIRPVSPDDGSSVLHNERDNHVQHVTPAPAQSRPWWKRKLRLTGRQGFPSQSEVPPVIHIGWELDALIMHQSISRRSSPPTGIGIQSGGWTAACRISWPSSSLISTPIIWIWMDIGLFIFRVNDSVRGKMHVAEKRLSGSV